MLSSYKIPDDDVLKVMLKTDDIKQGQRTISKLRPNQDQKTSKAGNQLKMMAQFFNQN